MNDENKLETWDDIRMDMHRRLEQMDRRQTREIRIWFGSLIILALAFFVFFYYF